MWLIESGREYFFVACGATVSLGLRVDCLVRHNSGRERNWKTKNGNSY